MSTIFGTKEEARRNLKSDSWLFIILAIVSIVTAVISFASGGLKDTAYEAAISENISPESATNFAGGLAIGVLVVAIILGLLQIYISYKGIKEANGAKQGGGYLVFMYFYLAIAAISFITLAYAKIRNGNTSDDWLPILTSLTDIIIAISFIGSAKTLRAGKH